MFEDENNISIWCDADYEHKLRIKRINYWAFDGHDEADIESKRCDQLFRDFRGSLRIILGHFFGAMLWAAIWGSLFYFLEYRRQVEIEMLKNFEKPP